MGRKKSPKRQEDKHRTNDRIRAKEVRIVNEGNGFTQGIYSTREALRLADKADLDLVEINGKPNPPICKIIDYKKFLYEQKLKEKENKQKSKPLPMKELKFTSNTADHDIEIKAKQAKKFLEKGHLVKTSLLFKGRNIIFKDRGKEVLLKFAQLVEDYGTPEAMPVLQGKRMFMTIRPKK